jgi:hypothetical protein
LETESPAVQQGFLLGGINISQIKVVPQAPCGL